MDSESIPDDVRNEATRICRYVKAIDEEAWKPIARALLAERERAAKIAENNDHFPQEGAFIAAAIRSDHTASMEAAAPGYLSRRRAIKEGE